MKSYKSVFFRVLPCPISHPCYRAAALLLLTALLLSGCGLGATPSPTPTSTPSSTPTRTATSTPTATWTPTDTPTPTYTPTPTRTPRPTRTPTPTSTPTPTPTPTRAPTSTPTAAPAAPAAAAPPPPPPQGDNLLINPGFEGAYQGWGFNAHVPQGWRMQSWQTNGQIVTVQSYPTWIHSGSQSFTGWNFAQDVHGVTPGATYRLGVWVKIWSSDGEDRTISHNPAPIDAAICVSVNGNLDNPYDPERAVCSAWVRPYDVWQYLTVDAVAQSDFIVVWLLSTMNHKLRGDVIWDDASLTAAPAAATPTPAVSRAARPAPTPFDANALYDAMVQTRSNIEQMGGLLDRLVREGSQSCREYLTWYDALVASPLYDGVPAEWNGVYTDYRWAVDHTLETSNTINYICSGQGGVLTELDYGVARTGVNDALNRLIPAVDAARAALGR